MGNQNLTSAKRAKNDEFYTQYNDIQKELEAYFEYNDTVFKGKTVYCNCDDPYESHFFQFFINNFNRYGLKKLVTTSFVPSPIVGGQLPLFEIKGLQGLNNKEPFKIEISAVKDFNNDGATNIYDVEWLLKNDVNVATKLKGNGDFRSDECITLLKQADIVVTNPPFSLFREYVAQLTQYNKQFVIIGNKNAITYKEIFPLIKDDKLWVGHTPMGIDLLFDVHGEFAEELVQTKKEGSAYKVIDGVIKARAQAVWFTNLDHGKRFDACPLMTMADNKKFNKKVINSDTCYQKYDNYNAIEVPFTSAIPSDYKGVMGVPISFLDKYCPRQFEIVGLTSGRDEFECRPIKKYLNPKQHNTNGTITNGSKANTRATLRLKEIPNSIYYTAENSEGALVIVYARILIKHKQPRIA